jgi:hypothetical protein
MVPGPGVYAVARAPRAGDSPQGLDQLTITPRVFGTGDRGGAAEVSISFRAGRAGNASVAVFNRSGRLVRRVADDLLFGAGINVVRWDGRDSDGAPVSEGVYLVRVSLGGVGKTVTMAVVR